MRARASTAKSPNSPRMTWVSAKVSRMTNGSPHFHSPRNPNQTGPKSAAAKLKLHTKFVLSPILVNSRR